MSDKKLSNPFSTGSGGGHFEAHVQASFVALMLTGGYAPCLPCWPITEIKLQGKISGYNTDDLIVVVEEPGSKRKSRMLGQVKHKISINKGDSVFSEVTQAAWKDFNNSKVFSKKKDIITLITGPLSSIDSTNVQWLLSQARYTKDLDEFERHVKQANFSPAKSTVKLEAIKHHLKIANRNQEISNEDLYIFLNHFHLIGYDLGEEEGVILSLLQSHISQFNRQHPHWVWARIVDIVQTWNQNAGTITYDKLPDDLKELFKQPTVSYFPSELIIQPEHKKDGWNQFQHAAAHAAINLVGGWNEENEQDLQAVNRILNEEYANWVLDAREMLQTPNSPYKFNNGIWEISNRVDQWEMLGSRLFDQTLDIFREIAVQVLSEYDPKFDLHPSERFAANIQGKDLTFSSFLRKGLAESLALLGNRSESLINCSQNKAQYTVLLTIRELFQKSNGILWGSLNSLLPDLAEASPDEFLDAVEQALSLVPCPFDELFSQEDMGIFGENYLTGLLWALEGLAWDEKYLVRVCTILGELASHDPGGKWSNRPANSLTTILLPWLPQTVASIEKRKVAVQTLCKEFPTIAWKLIISLLPNQHQLSSGSHKPKWRKTTPEEKEKGVSQNEYWNQVENYAEIAVSMASKNRSLLIELIEHLDDLPKPSFDQVLKILLSEATVGLSEEGRLPIWNKLVKLTSRHRSFSEAEWALNDEKLSILEDVADKLSPSDPQYLYQRLFNEVDVDLYEEQGNWEEQGKKLAASRQKAVEEILSNKGINELIHFAEAVAFPSQVGGFLAAVADEKMDSILIPKYLEFEDSRLAEFISGYIWRRHYINGWSWADSLKKNRWSSKQIRNFLKYLPFTRETWERVEKWLGNSEVDYWHKVNGNPYQPEGDFDFAIDKLIEYGRPHAAITYLYAMYHLKKPMKTTQIINALTKAVSSSEPSSFINSYHIVELIKFLQEAPDVQSDDLFGIEWAYLALLNREHRSSPKLLEKYLANNPEFFCQIIQMIYRSTKNVLVIESSEETKEAASNAWNLLHSWKTPPGTQEDGSFNNLHFSTWLQRVKDICRESGHLEVALINVGEVLIHTPSDIDGLWINHSVAEALNSRDADEMRRGFRTGSYNSRGTHWVDPIGKPERELAMHYRKKAEDVENAGYHRFAVTLRKLSETYDREAEQIIAEHNDEE